MRTKTPFASVGLSQAMFGVVVVDVVVVVVVEVVEVVVVAVVVVVVVVVGCQGGSRRSGGVWKVVVLVELCPHSRGRRTSDRQ